MVYRFGDFELNEFARELTRQGERVTLEPKVFDLLCLLIRHRRRVLHRDVLLRELWPAVIVSEASLSRLVKEARRAVGDDGDLQSIIRTVRGSGYRFVGELASDPVEAGWDEAERLISHAKLTLDAAIERAWRDLRAQIDEFTRACDVAVAAAREEGR